jgi:hypothetical protein
LQRGASVVFSASIEPNEVTFQAQPKSGSRSNDFLQPFSTAVRQSDDTYRAAGLYPGTYVLSGYDSGDPACDERCLPDFTPWFSGDVGEPERAVPVKLSSGRTLQVTPALVRRRPLTITFSGLPASTQVSVTAWSAATGRPLWWDEATLTDGVVTFDDRVAIPVKLRIKAVHADMKTRSWWFGGTSKQSATVVAGETVTITAPR